ncbi:MAG: tRNA pseudouridine(55) synthase TruB, partial [Chloroflexi bacterium]|nr:tRNA pseudouridine(55) synthase TruB [Chloroflexota bacterium]
MNGLLIVDKPSGPTSHDVVYKVRKWSNERRIGHAGTLDPMATGVLVLCMGPATRLAEYLLNGDKRYRAVVRLGQTTDTYDAQGRVLDSRPVDCTPEQIESALAAFRGAIEQTPPAFSAIQVNGQRAYDLARRGQAPDLKPRAITIHSLTLVGWSAPDATLEVACSAGTYIRSLAHDLGQALGCGAHLVALRRTAAGQFSVHQAVALDRLRQAFATGDWRRYLRPMDEVL